MSRPHCLSELRQRFRSLWAWRSKTLRRKAQQAPPAVTAPRPTKVLLMYYVCGRRSDGTRLILSIHLRLTLARRAADSFRAQLGGFAAIEVEPAGGLTANDAARGAGTLKFCPTCQRKTTKLYTCRHCRVQQCCRCNSKMKCCSNLSPH